MGFQSFNDNKKVRVLEASTTRRRDTLQAITRHFGAINIHEKHDLERKSEDYVK